MKRALLVCLLGVLMVSGVAQGASKIVLFDNFESYGSQAAFQAAWPAWGTAIGGVATSMVMNYDVYGWPRTAQQNPEVGWIPSDGRAAQRYVGPQAAGYYRNGRVLSQRVVPSDDNPLVWQFDMFDPGDSSGSLKTNREFCNLQQYSAANPTAYGATAMISMGSTAATSNIATALVQKWQYRIYLDSQWSGMSFTKPDGTTLASNTWTFLNSYRPGTGGGRPSSGWYRFQSRVYRSKVEFWVNGTLDTTLTVNNPNWGAGFNVFQMGSGQSTNAAMLIDNAMIATPEPAGLVLLMGAGALLLRQRRRSA